MNGISPQTISYKRTPSDQVAADLEYKIKFCFLNKNRMSIFYLIPKIVPKFFSSLNEMRRLVNEFEGLSNKYRAW